MPVVLSLLHLLLPLLLRLELLEVRQQLALHHQHRQTGRSARRNLPPLLPPGAC